MSEFGIVGCGEIGRAQVTHAILKVLEDSGCEVSIVYHDTKEELIIMDQSELIHDFIFDLKPELPPRDSEKWQGRGKRKMGIVK